MQSLTLDGASQPLLQSVLVLAVGATRDRIPNVRFTAAQVRRALCPDVCVRPAGLALRGLAIVVWDYNPRTPFEPTHII